MTMGIGEYLPSYVDDAGKSVKSIDKSQVYVKESFYSPSLCSTETQDEHKELNERKFIVRCSENVKSFPLPQNFSRLTKVRDDAGNKVLFFRTPNDPRVLVDARKGTNTYYVSQPRVGDLFDYVLTKIFRS